MMHTLTIHLDPALEKRGFSGVKAFEDDEIYITIGSTNEAALPKLGQVRVSFETMGVQVIGGPAFYNEWHRRFQSGDNGRGIHAFAFEMLLQGLTPERMRTILENVRKDAYKRGKNDLRAEIHDLLEPD